MTPEEFWQIIKNFVASDDMYSSLPDLQRRLISSWASCCGYAILNLRFRDSNRLITFDSYEPCSFPFSNHKCSRPFDIKPNSSGNNNHPQVPTTAKFSLYIEKCRATQSDICCNEAKRKFNTDPAFRQRRYCTRAVVFAIISQFNSASEKKLYFGKLDCFQNSHDNSSVDRFHSGNYTLPRGYQCCIQSHQDSNCSQTEYFLTIRAQHNAFNCTTHQNYGATQVRQLAFKGKKPYQEESFYLLTNGYYFCFGRVNWAKAQESVKIFTVAAELDALVAYGVSLLQEKAKEKTILPEISHFPQDVTLLSTHKGKVAIVGYKENRFALKFHINEDSDANSNPELQAIQKLSNMDNKCDKILIPNIYHFNKFSLTVAVYHGPSLFDICLCDQKRNQIIANTVKSDIGSALEYLHKNKLVFVDVHPGNILYNEINGAKLIDFESMRQLGSKSDVKVIPFFKTHEFDSDNLTAKQDFSSLQLVIHWILNTSNIRGLYYYNHAMNESEEIRLQNLVLNQIG